ncbi:MAG TPA: copper-binding protein [Rubrivivax sp.]|nr:copper-binding protein [Rubrivivax sp.]
MNTTRMTLIAACLVLLTPLGASADEAHDRPPAAATAGDAEMTDGEVRKIDLAAGKLTLKHAEIKNLDMPAMTMVFAVRDKAMLDKLKPGDKVRFKAVDDGGKLTLSEIRPAP